MASFNEPEDARLIEDVDLYKEFISESCEHLQDTEADILSLEENPQDMETLNSIFRCVHSIKGSAGFIGLEKMQALSHELETVLDKARKGELEIKPSITDVFLSSVDALGKLMDCLSLRILRVADVECERMGKADVEEDIDISNSLDEIKSLLISNMENDNGSKKKDTKKNKSSKKKSNRKKKTKSTISYDEPDSAKLNEDAELYKEFISESCEHLQDTESDILSLEDNPGDTEVLNSIFRCVHSIKGSAGFLGLEKMQALSHELETVLDKARKNELVVNNNITDVFLGSVDTLGRLIDNLSLKILNASGVECERLGKSDSDGDIDIAQSLESIKSILESNNTDDVDTSGDIIEEDKAENKDTNDEEQEEPQKLGDILVKEGVANQQQIEEAVSIREKKIGEILVERGVVSEKQVEKAVKKQNDQKQQVAKTTLKVDTAKLDALFDLVGELVITHSLINEEIASLQIQNNNGTNQNLSQLGKIVKDLQDQTMSLRMVPLKQTFQKMSRLVRDIATGCGKSVKLDISGEDTELDKNVIEKIADPLVHILRNAVDHGIETVEDRISVNKPKEGHVHLNAFHRGGNIVIEIEDDGKGLSKDRILKKAVEKGVISDPSSLNDDQIYNLIFAPGFSTAEKVTNISGRGVGMDVVKRNIDNLQGKVDITSEEGNGSKFSIKLPLTLAIIDGIVIEVEKTRYIAPIIAVEESIRPDRELLSTIRKKEEVLTIRGELIPLVRLHDLFLLGTESKDLSDAIVVIVHTEGYKFGIVADALLGQQQVVIKSLGKRFNNSKGISGAAIMGNGDVGLIIDINGIRELAFNK